MTTLSLSLTVFYIKYSAKYTMDHQSQQHVQACSVSDPDAVKEPSIYKPAESF